MEQLFSGAMAMGYAVISLFFLRFWKRTHDRLFILFSAAFGVLTVQRLTLALTVEHIEDDLLFYVVRLLAFLLILAAIIDKNRSSR